MIDANGRITLVNLQMRALLQVVIGETGSQFETDDDNNFMDSFGNWLRALSGTGQNLFLFIMITASQCKCGKLASQQLCSVSGDAHTPIKNVAWWDWNANSGDTVRFFLGIPEHWEPLSQLLWQSEYIELTMQGGIVDGSWVTILFYKLDWLITNVGLNPWCNQLLVYIIINHFDVSAACAIVPCQP